VADYVVRDGSGRVIGRISEAGPGCWGCLGMSVIAIAIWLAVSAYQYVQARRTLNGIEAQRVRLSNEALDTVVGEYDYTRYKIRIEHRGDKLYNISPEEFCELVPISSQEFIYKACPNGFRGRARFERDARGKLVLVITHQDGRTERADRVN
jgi:hypothetical protein